MHITIIGGTGHIGKHLVPMLVREGHEVTVVSRGKAAFPQDAEWQRVKRVAVEYGRAGWTETVQEIGAEVMVDLLQNDSPALYDAVRASVGHFVVCGSIWMFGMARVVPTPDRPQGPCLYDGYARRFAQMGEVMKRAKADGVAFTGLMEPNICGPGKVPLEGKGGRRIEMHRSHQRGETVILPAPGNNLVGPCDAEDVARSFLCAIAERKAAAGELFNVGPAYSLTMNEFIETYGRIYGVSIPMEYVGWEQFTKEVVTEPTAYWHFQYNMCPEIAKISSRLGYRPRFTPEQTMERAVKWMKQEELL